MEAVGDLPGDGSFPLEAGFAAGFLRIALTSSATALSEGKRSDAFFAVIRRQRASIRGSTSGRSSLGRVKSLAMICRQNIHHRTPEWQLAGEHFVEDDSETVLIRSRSDLVLIGLDLLG